MLSIDARSVLSTFDFNFLRFAIGLLLISVSIMELKKWNQEPAEEVS